MSGRFHPGPSLLVAWPGMDLRRIGQHVGRHVGRRVGGAGGRRHGAPLVDWGWLCGQRRSPVQVEWSPRRGVGGVV